MIDVHAQSQPAICHHKSPRPWPACIPPAPVWLKARKLIGKTTFADGYRESFPGFLRDLLTAPASCRSLETNLKRAPPFHS
ncbi:hypothetical protein BIWAKO_00302 [Bosea sp. BIWAKO-01]|nr:hypothetical protein BIWAKO_00302 [Bosea sp. BIWAKO-01]